MAALILGYELNPKMLWVSPETRAQESAQALNSVLNIESVEIRKEIDEVDAPNEYLGGVTMEEHRKIVEDPKRLAEIQTLYPAEDDYHVAERMAAAFEEMGRGLSIGESGIIVSHGHPIAFLTYRLLYPDKEIPSGAELYKTDLYCPKGSAMVVIVSGDGTIENLKFLKEKDTGRIYFKKAENRGL